MLRLLMHNWKVKVAHDSKQIHKNMKQMKRKSDNKNMCELNQQQRQQLKKNETKKWNERMRWECMMNIGKSVCLCVHMRMCVSICRWFISIFINSFCILFFNKKKLIYRDQVRIQLGVNKKMLMFELEQMSQRISLWWESILQI